MKTNHISILCGLLLLLFATACSDEVLQDNSDRLITVTASMPGAQSPGNSPSGPRRIALAQNDGSLDLITKWEEGDEIQLFVKQGNKVYTAESSKVKNISEDGKTCTFTFFLPPEVKIGTPYAPFEVLGLCDVEGINSGDAVLAKSKLRRVRWEKLTDTFAPMWFHVSQGASGLQTYFQHLGTYEVLHVKNTSKVGVMFQHCGFDVEWPWYKFEENTPLDENYNPSQYTSEPGDTESPSALIGAGATGTYLSWYVPTGLNINDAHLLAKIDNKQVTSVNTKSSAVNIQRGHAYHMYATWDGNELRFDDGDITHLQLAANTLALTTGNSGTVDIVSGSGSYSVKTSNKKIATAKIVNAAVKITAVAEGSATITVTDTQTSETAKIKVTVKKAGEVQTETFTVNGVSFTMVGVEGGTFWMGSADDDADADVDEKPRHQVTLSSFSIGQTEVTQALWEAVMGSNPSFDKGENRPVSTVYWNDCQKFITKLNALTGRTFRLPTEAEWEYAARGGKYSHGYKYAGSDDIDEVAWYDSNSKSDKHHPVAQKKANELGLYDMSGNVYEWCQDWYDENFYGRSFSNNPCNKTEASYRVIRGGGWSTAARGCRVADRYLFVPDHGSTFLGLRLAL